jgi:GT2 family glycosyltransferase
MSEDGARLRLHTILINYQTPDMTIDSLASFMKEMGDRQDFAVTLVDNASGDGSVARLQAELQRQGWQDRVTLVESDRNGGFAYGVNAGLRHCEQGQPPEYVYLLNSDAFPGKGAVDRLVEFLDEHPAIGIAGSYIHGPEGEPHVTAFRFPSILGEIEAAMRLGILTRLLARWRVPIEPIPQQDLRVDWLAGASMLIRHDVFRAIGPFDDEFFLYYEETDFCRRALSEGWETWYLPGSQVMHIGSVSTGMKNVEQRMPAYWFESRAHYFRKNHGRLYLWVSDLSWVLSHATWRVRRAIQRKPDSDNPGLLGDFIRAMFRSPSR